MDKTSNFGFFETVMVLKVGCLPKVVCTKKINFKQINK
jgi:hypothetical protein